MQRGRELKQRPWGVPLTGLLSTAYATCFLIYTQTTYPRVSSLTVIWDYPHQSSTKKMAYRLPHKLTHRHIFSVKRSSQRAYLCQADVETSQHSSCEAFPVQASLINLGAIFFFLMKLYYINCLYIESFFVLSKDIYLQIGIHADQPGLELTIQLSMMLNI